MKAKCKAKSVKEPLFQSYEHELERMISGPTDTDAVLHDMEKQILMVLNKCGHHAAGCKAAKARFQGMLGWATVVACLADVSCPRWPTWIFQKLPWRG